MQNTFQKLLSSYRASHTRRRRMLAVMLTLSMLVSGTVFYQLRLTGISMSGEAYCGKVEHEHTEACIQRELICTVPEEEGHTHGDECYESTSVLICTNEDVHVHGEGCYATAPTSPTEDAHIHGEGCYATATTDTAEDAHIHGEGCYATAPVLTCTMNAHTHGEDCYATDPVLTCTTNAHTHGEGCYETTSTQVCWKEYDHQHEEACFNEEGAPVCGLEELPHTHGEGCFTTETSLTCTAEEHVHGESCYESQPRLVCTAEEHTHGEDCYESQSTLVCTIEENASGEDPSEPILICTVEENASGEEQPILICTEGHTHGDACYETESTLICTEEETGHTHDDSCYEEEYICGVAEEELHLHSLQCYSNPEADLETAAEWYSMAQQLELPEDWDEALMKLALSQLGCRESSENFLVAEDGISVNGITRYGQWSGDPYGDWNSAFIRWCLHYAGIPDEECPRGSSCAGWAADLRANEALLSVSEVLPEAGDLVFLDDDQDGITDCAAIMESTEYDEEERLLLDLIQGDWENTVGRRKYLAASSQIVGYWDVSEAYIRYLVKLAELEEANAPEVVTLEASIFTDGTYAEEDTSNVRIEVTGALEAGAVVKAFPVEMEIEGKSVLCAYDISIFLEDGTLYEPSEPLTVSFIAPELVEEDSQPEIYYVPEEGEPQNMESTLTDEGITFEADHFSVYAWVDGASELNNAAALKTAVNEAATDGNDTYLKLAGDMTFTGADVMSVPANAKVFIDLNGHSITFGSEGDQSLFTVPANAALTIVDSLPEALEPSESIGAGVSVGPRDAGKAAEMAKTDNGVTLTYYVTDSTVISSPVISPLDGRTTEKRYKHTVTSKGIIRGSNSGNLFSVTGGTLTIESGFLYGEESEAVGRAIDISNGGTVNLSGGYICGFSRLEVPQDNLEYNFGGAIFVQTGGTLNISGSAVLAGNKATSGGAISARDNGSKVNISGGILSGNTATKDCGSLDSDKTYGGGAIFAVNHASVSMSAGYITNNNASATGYFSGGGGIMLHYYSSFSMSGGYITGNTGNGGGGVRTSFYSPNTVTISNGYICANHARSAEGGGVCIDNQGTCDVKNAAGSKIYVNNNVTDTTQHWGGGGLFVANGGSMFIQNALITENHAGGYGGGVAGCSTGRVVIALQNGAAIFNNTAEGLYLSGDESTKNDDNSYAALNEVFLKYGYQDYYCALASTVLGGMLGDYSANWTGSMDGTVITGSEANQLLNSSYIMGLTAHPTDDAIAAAKQLAGVYVTGNSSHTHGGGVLSNGQLMVGNVLNFEIGDSLELIAEKALLDGNSGTRPVKEGDFTFEVIDELNHVVSSGVTQDGGGIFFDRRLSFDKAGTYTYHIRETGSKDPSVIMDTTKYVLTVTVVDDTRNLSTFDTPIPFVFHKITHIKLTSGEAPNLTTHFDANVNSSDDSAYHFEMPKPAFTNYELSTIEITVQKKWVGTPSVDSVTVDLYRNGNILTNKTITLSASNTPAWTYTWENLETHEAGTDIPYGYEVKERVPNGYVATYAFSSPTAEKYWVPATTLTAGERYILVNPTGEWVLSQTVDHANARFDETDTAPITQKTETKTINGIDYTSWYKDADISSNMIFTAATKGDGLLLRNYGLPASWLLVQENAGHTLKGTSGDAWASYMRLEGDILQGQYGYDGAGDWYNIVFSGDHFDASSDSTTGAVKLFTQITKQQIDQSTTVTITNTPVDDARYKLSITKQDKWDSNIKLPNATFQLLNAQNSPVNFTQEKAGIYNAVESPRDGTTGDVITVAGGKLLLQNLKAGTYTLQEKTAPTGYYTTADIIITLEEGEGNIVYIPVEDERIVGPVLPETGNMGIFPFLLSGLLTIMLAALLLMQQKRKAAGRFQK